MNSMSELDKVKSVYDDRVNQVREIRKNRYGYGIKSVVNKSCYNIVTLADLVHFKAAELIDASTPTQIDEISQLKEHNEKLKLIIIDMMVSNAKLRVPSGHCPYAYFSIEGETQKEQGCDDCPNCKANFWDKYRQQMYSQNIDSL